MTLTTRVVLSSVMLAVAAALAPTAQAQVPGTTAVAVIRPEPGRLIEGYYAHYRFALPGDRVGMNGIGARLMWNPARADYGSTALPSRFALGLFGEYVPEQDKGFSVGHVGVQGDMNVFRTPLYGRVSPVLSLGAGMLWSDKSGPAISSPKFSLANESAKMFSLAPSLGTRVGLWRQLDLRADVRDLMTFRDETRHHVQFAAGLSFPL
jgi:hypothetical protein